ncbi:MAG: hypothetical protein AAFY88_22660 [Acidobacteriota bacterium]
MIVLDQEIRPSRAPSGDRGFQVVVLDRTNPSSSGVVYNEYFSVPHDASYDEDYEPMYDEMASELQAFPSREYLLVLASFGISSNAPPTRDLEGFLVAAGAGDLLAQFIDEADPGSNLEDWPGIYTLVGVPGLELGSGVELFATIFSYEPINARQRVRFYRQRGATNYTVGLISQSDAEADLRREFLVSGKSQGIVAILSQPEVERSYRLGDI